MSNKYLIDTSVWIDYFRDSNKELNDFIDRLIDEDAVHINGIIKSELLIGTKTQKEFDQMKRELQCFHNLKIDDHIFSETSRIGFLLKRKGITVPLTDLIIAVHSSYHNLILIENDKHYRIIKQYLDLELYASLFEEK